ncbi:MAG: serine/threonine-protein kinase [Roseibacillus sp.]
MQNERPDSDLIQRWIAGTLNAEQARVVEFYFEQHPEELPDPLVPPLLKEAAHTTSPEVGELIETLKKQFTNQASNAVGITSWVDLLTPSDEPELLGHLGGLEVLEVVATTAMAIVLKARDPKNDRLVAIKILSPVFATQDTARERFLREASAMASLQHESILPVYQVQADDIPWFTMRYVEGGTLQDALDAKEPFLSTPEFIERLATKVAQALALAHREGLIHRDIKPANILLSSDRAQIWLADFGIARATDDPSLTQGQALAGTPRYMSPEQAHGAPLDSRSDIFSLGAVLYHCATGHPPFPGESSTQVLHQISTTEPTPLPSIRPGLPTWLSQLIHDCLQKKPSQRPEILTALRERSARRKPLLKSIAIAAAGLIALGLILTGVHFLTNGSKNKQHQKSKKSSLQKIFVPDTGKYYADLAQAIHESPPNSILELDGTFLIQERIITEPGIGLHLRAAPGTQPQIIIRGALIGLEINGNTTLEGIHFKHYGLPGEKSILIARNAETLTVSDCSFLSDARAATDIKPLWALTALSIDKTTVERCTFQGQTMGAIVLYDAKYTRPFRNGNLTLKHCLFNCSCGVHLRARSPQSEFDIIAEKIIFRGNYFLAGSSHNDFRPTRFTLRDSLLDATEAVIFDYQGNLRNSKKQLAITIENSLYAGPEGALVVTGEKATVERLPAIDDAKALLFGKKELLPGSLPTNLTHPAMATFETAPRPNPDFQFPRNHR